MYKPDFIVPPGEILEETLEARSLGKGEFARRAGLSMKTVSLILAGKAPILPDTALQFERVLGVSAELWIGLESRYRLALARKAASQAEDDLALWAKRFPRFELVKRGVVRSEAKDAEAGRDILSFFGVANREAWRDLYGRVGDGEAVSFRRAVSAEGGQEKLASWLRLAELGAQDVETGSFDKRVFERVVRQARDLTTEDFGSFLPRLRGLCSQSGVAFVLVPAISGCGVYGATRWLSKGKAILALSNLRKGEDQFWFSFFHEAGHILLHGKDETFIEGCEGLSVAKEEEADSFAREVLIPPNDWDEFVSGDRFFEPDIRSFSVRVGVSPGIVVGFLQHFGLIRNEWHNGLKRRYNEPNCLDRKV